MNLEREQRRTVRDDHPYRSSIRDDDAPAARAPEASHPAPTVRRNPGEPNLEAVLGDVRIWLTRVARDGRNNTEHRLSRRDCDKSESSARPLRTTSVTRCPTAGDASVVAIEMLNFASAGAHTTGPSPARSYACKTCQVLRTRIQLLIRILRREDGAFMEPSGRNQWQPVANA